MVETTKLDRLPISLGSLEGIKMGVVFLESKEEENLFAGVNGGSVPVYCCDNMGSFMAVLSGGCWQIFNKKTREALVFSLKAEGEKFSAFDAPPRILSGSSVELRLGEKEWRKFNVETGKEVEKN